MFLAWRNLLQSKTRLALSVAGVALAMMLILLLGGFRRGVYRQIAAYPEHAPGPVVVAQEGVSNLLAASSLLPPGAEQAARETDGVASVVPILSQFAILELHDRKVPAYLVGYDPARGGGPWRLASGREPVATGEVVIDRVLAGRHSLRLGDSFTFGGQAFQVVGLSEETTSWMTSYIFMDKRAVESLLVAPGATSFLFVTPGDGTSTEDLQNRLGSISGTDALLKTDMVAADLRVYGRVLNAPLRLMVGIAFVIGTLVVGLVIYTATVERRREYGVLKAVGAPNRMLYGVVAAQALAATAAGAVAGAGLAFLAGTLIMAARPQFLVAIEAAAVGAMLASALLMALLAALAPARVVAGLAPADVFRR